VLKQGRSYYFSAHTAVGSIVVILFSGIAVTGGPMHTEVHPLLTVPVVFAFLLLGQLGGLIWTSLTVVIYFVFVGFNSMQFQFLNLPPEDVRGMLRIFNWSYGFVVVAALVSLY